MRPLPLFAAAFIVVSVGTALAAVTTCSVGRVTLAALPAATTYTFGTDAYTVGFCAPAVPTSTSLQSCGGAGYVQDHLVATQACIRSYSVVTVGLTQYTAGTETGVFFTVATQSDPSTMANVTIACDTAGTTGVASLTRVTSANASGTSVLSLKFSGYDGCSVSSLFCDATTACADSTKSCVNGICFQTACARLATTASIVYPSSAASLTFSVADCTGTPLSGLTSTSFSYYVNSQDVAQPPYSGEVPVAFALAAQSVPAITTLLLDQSRSVTSGASQALLQAAATTYVNTVAAQNTNHYVALIAFDGSASPVVVQSYTTNTAAVVAAISGSLPPAASTDPDSTNLYGAVVNAIALANAQRFAFGSANASVISTMIVFTDGYDTAGRSTAAAAIAAANNFASTVSIVSIGVATTSDTAFLRSIATSGLYSFPSTSSLVSSFTDVANQVSLRANSVYTAAMCVPIRSGAATVTVGMNASAGYATQSFATVVLNASQVTGGCTQTTANALALSAAQSNATSGASKPTSVAFGTATSQVIAPYGAYFVDYTQSFNNPTYAVAVSPPVLSVYTVAGSRCQLSPYCFDTLFNGSASLSAPQGTVAHFMVLNPTAVAVTATITIGTVTTSAPPTFAPGLTPVTPAPPTPAPPAAFVLVYNVSEVSPADVDNAAAWVFFGYGILLFVLAATVIFLKACFVPNAQQAALEAAAAKSPQGSYRVPLQIGLVGDSAVYARTPSVGLQSPQYNPSASVMAPQSLMMTPTLGTGVSPYRATPYRTVLPSGRAFYDPSVDSGRWSPRRNQDDL